MIAKAFICQNPFEVWGDGSQVRNWTYIGDIVDGTILAAEKIDDATAVNLGTMERVTVLDAVKLVMEYSGHRAKSPSAPTCRSDRSIGWRIILWQKDFWAGSRR